MRRRQVLIGFGAALVTACGATPAANVPTTTVQTTQSPTPAPTKGPRRKLTVALGAKASLILLPWDFAAAASYFEDENLEIEFQYPGAPQAAAAVIAGTVDFTGGAIDSTIRAQLQSKPTKMVASFTRLPGLGLVIRGDLKDQLRSLKDLRGATIGIPSQGSGAHVLLTYLLQQEGLEPEKDYKLLPYAPATPAGALDKGDMTAAAAFDPFVSDYVASGKGVLLLDLRKEEDTLKALGGRYQFTGAITRKELIDKDPGLVQRAVTALVRADRFIAGSPAEDVVAKLPTDVVGNNRDLYLATIRAYKLYMSPDGLVERSGVDNMLKVNTVFAKAYPQLAQFKADDRIDVESLYDMRFVNAAPK